MKKKLYLVKREVWAKNIQDALINKGKVYEISETQTEKNTKDVIGFITPKSNGQNKNKKRNSSK